MSTVRMIVFLLQVILVSVGVKCACIEDDCRGQAIIVVNPSGECVSCFPCPPCEEGQTPSVRCASTVLQGREIHCVPIAPSPSVISTSVLSWHTSITGTSRQITATVHTHEHPSVSASSKDYAGISSSNSKENTGSTIIPENYSNLGSTRTVVYLLCGILLPFIFLGIFWKLRKSKTIRAPPAIGNHTMASSPPSSMTGATHVDNSVHAVHLHPENSSPLFVPSYTNNGQQDAPEGNENHPIQPQHNQTFHEESGIPSSLDDNNAQAASQQFFIAALQNGGASEMKKQITETEKYRCKMNQVPFCHLHKICLTLDIKRGADGRDVREFASKLNIPVPEFERLQQAAEIQRTTTTSVILSQWVPSSWTVGDFVKIMKEMERQDIIDLINEWE